MVDKFLWNTGLGQLRVFASVNFVPVKFQSSYTCVRDG